MSSKEYAMMLRVGDGYLCDLQTILPILDSDNSTAHAHLVPFIVMCAATLEAILNEEIVSWAFSKFPKDRYKSAADAILSMSFRGKLDMIVPLITENRFLIRTNSVEYKSLAQLISRRNELMHSRSYYQFVEENNVLPDTDRSRYNVAPPKNEKTKAECMLYYSSLEGLYEKLLYPIDERRLEENDMIIKNRSHEVNF